MTSRSRGRLGLLVSVGLASGCESECDFIETWHDGQGGAATTPDDTVSLALVDEVRVERGARRLGYHVPQACMPRHRNRVGSVTFEVAITSEQPVPGAWHIWVHDGTSPSWVDPYAPNGRTNLVSAWLTHESETDLDSQYPIELKWNDWPPDEQEELDFVLAVSLLRLHDDGTESESSPIYVEVVSPPR